MLTNEPKFNATVQARNTTTQVSSSNEPTNLKQNLLAATNYNLEAEQHLKI